MEITKALRIWTLTVVVLSLVTTILHQWHTRRQVQQAQFLLDKYDNEHSIDSDDDAEAEAYSNGENFVALDEKVLPLATHRQRERQRILQVDADDDYVAYYSEDEDYYIGNNGNGYGSGGKPNKPNKPKPTRPAPVPVPVPAPVLVIPATTDPPVSPPTDAAPVPVVPPPTTADGPPVPPPPTPDVPAVPLPVTDAPVPPPPTDAPVTPVPPPTDKLPVVLTDSPTMKLREPGAATAPPGITSAPTSTEAPSTAEEPVVTTSTAAPSTTEEPVVTTGGTTTSPTILSTTAQTTTQTTTTTSVPTTMTTSVPTATTSSFGSAGGSAAKLGDLQELFACLQINQVAMEVWFGQGTDPQCLSNTCASQPNACCRYHPGHELRCDSSNEYAKYPCLCSDYTADPTTLPISDIQLQLPMLTMPPTEVYGTFAPTISSVPTTSTTTNTGTAGGAGATTASPTEAATTTTPVITTTTDSPTISVPTTTTDSPTIPVPPTTSTPTGAPAGISVQASRYHTATTSPTLEMEFVAIQSENSAGNASPVAATNASPVSAAAKPSPTATPSVMPSAVPTTATPSVVPTEFVDRGGLIESEPCIPFDQASPLVFHPRTDVICRTNECGPDGCCRIHSWLICDKSNFFVDSPCVCNDYTSTNAATVSREGHEGSYINEEQEQEEAEDQEETIDTVTSTSTTTTATSTELESSSGINPEICANGSPLYTNPSFAHFTRCSTSSECSALDSSHCCLERFCMCGIPHTSALEECVPPFVLPPTDPPTMSPTVLPTEEPEPEDEDDDEDDQGDEDQDDSESVCANGSIFHSLASFAHFTPCVTSMDCAGETNHCCLERYCLCGPPNEDATTECIGPFPFLDEGLPLFTTAPAGSSGTREDDPGNDVVVEAPTNPPTPLPTNPPTRFPTNPPTPLPQPPTTEAPVAPMIPLIEYQPCRSFDDDGIANHLTHPNAHEVCQTNSCNRGCCRAYWWLVCDEKNDFSYVPCVCNENTQDPNNFVAHVPPEPVIEPWDECRNGSPFQSQKGFEEYEKCYDAQGCNAEEGECCLSRYCLCGRSHREGGCVPHGPDQEELLGLGGDDAETAIDFNSDVARDFEEAAAVTLDHPLATDSNIIRLEPLVETVACVPFEGNILVHAEHPNSDESCKTNSCNNGCCRSYWWLVCDEDNAFPFAPCICNQNTRDPAAFPQEAPVDPVDGSAPEEACREGSFFQAHPSFTAMTPCYAGNECGEIGQCCLKSYCLCGVPSNVTDECVPPLPGTFTASPTGRPTTARPTELPSASPTELPSALPTAMPTTMEPTTPFPSAVPTETPEPPPLDICEDGHPVFHTNPSFAQFDKCVTSNDCPSSMGECCLANYCLCGPPRANATWECVPSIDQSGEVVEEELAPIEVPPTKNPSNELTTPLIETVACVPFDGSILVHAEHPNTEETCRTNTCGGGCCRSYWWLLCDESNSYKFAPCICNENTQDPDEFEPPPPPTPSPTDFERGPEHECMDGSAYHNLPSFSSLAPCFSADDCGANGCCMKQYCFCGASQNFEDECVPFAPPVDDELEVDAVVVVEDISDVEEIIVEDIELEEINATASPTGSVTTSTTEGELELQEADIVAATSSPTNDVFLIEQVACVPFDGSIIIHSEHPSSDASCKTNTCPNGCCRSYWWLLCDEDNAYTFAPCVCNENTQDPEHFVSNKPVQTEIPKSEAAANPDVCIDGSPYQRLPSFRHLTPCSDGQGCGEGECCVARYCLCMNPTALDECVVPVPENVVLDISINV